MMEPGIFEKLKVKPGYCAAIIRAPVEFPLAEAGLRFSGKVKSCDYVHLFAETIEEFYAGMERAMELMKPGGLLWASYPKLKGRERGELSRNLIWDLSLEQGFHPVAQVSLDSRWSAVRLMKNRADTSYTRPVPSGKKGQDSNGRAHLLVPECPISFPEKRRRRQEAVIGFLRKNYPMCSESMYYSPQNSIPIFKYPGEGRYVAVADRNGYLSIHFASSDAAAVVAAADPQIQHGVGCVKIPDSAKFPVKEIQKAIEICFS